MNSKGIGRHLAAAFALAVVIYAVTFYLIEGARKRHGPWRVRFDTSGGTASVTVVQPRLDIESARFVFPGAALPDGRSGTVVFDEPVTNVPFGKVVFLDTTFLPGTVTMDLFGHEVELLPRTLVVDKKEIPWKSDMTLNLEVQTEGDEVNRK